MQKPRSGKARGHWRRYLLCAALLLAACCPPARLEHDAYIWQRVWRPELNSAIRQSAAQIRCWRVLAAEATADGEWQTSAIDWSALNNGRRPVVMVIRIDGRLPPAAQAGLQARILALLPLWQRHTRLLGLEIDHDCPSAALGDYSRFLAALRQRLGCRLRLSITTLPTWLQAPQLDQLLAQVDESVLQVHAVIQPHQGLFNPQQAERWIRSYAGHRRVFRVALPTYGSRIDYDPQGNISAISSETPTPGGGADAREWVVAPQQVAELLALLQQQPVSGLLGVVWFRLPTSQDQRAWSLDTWRAVMNGAPLHPALQLYFQAGAESGLYQVVLRNPGSIDAMLPLSLALACPLGDAMAGYSASPANGGYRFTRTQQALLHPGQQRVIGWLRCPAGAPRGQT